MASDVTLLRSETSPAAGSPFLIALGSMVPPANAAAAPSCCHFVYDCSSVCVQPCLLTCIVLLVTTATCVQVAIDLLHHAAEATLLVLYPVAAGSLPLSLLCKQDVAG